MIDIYSNYRLETKIRTDVRQTDWRTDKYTDDQRDTIVWQGIKNGELDFRDIFKEFSWAWVKITPFWLHH